MAFSIRNIISNISYFSKSEEESLENENQTEFDIENRQEDYFSVVTATENVNFDRAEADSTTKCAKSLNLPVSIKNRASTKASLSDTDILTSKSNPGTSQPRKKCKKLRLDIDKASQSTSDTVDLSDNSPVNIENTPKHKLLEGRDLEAFKNLNFNHSFDISDVVSMGSSSEDELDIDLLSEHSDSESADTDDGKRIKLCRKVEPRPPSELVPSATPESFGDIEIEQNDDERVSQLLNYQVKMEKVECLLKKLLTEFKFHIKVSKIFDCKSMDRALPGTDMANVPKSLGEVSYIDNIQRGVSPAGWNVVENEDKITKAKLKNQLVNLRNSIDMFVNHYLEEKPQLTRENRSNTFDLHKGKRYHKRTQVSNKKKIKHYDFPDLRDAMVNLFSSSDLNSSYSEDDPPSPKCKCCCHNDSNSIKSEKETNHSISSSIGNFTLDSTALTAYSESLDMILSYNSFQDTSLYSTLLQKSAVERITFYVQVHSIQINSDSTNHITFYCPACSIAETDENSLLKHILSPEHCEKIHFLYKTAYVKKCIATGKEIMPSTVLNPMTMYRDYNKIVCFGDAVYACSLCFEGVIVGESVLMAHCVEEEHVYRRERLPEIFE